MTMENAYNLLDHTLGQNALDIEETLFVRRLQAKEDAAYDQLIRIYSSSMFNIAYRMLSDSAEASYVVQETFLKVFRNISSFTAGVALQTWIFKILFAEIRNRLRFWRPTRRSALDEPLRGGGERFRDIVVVSNPTSEQTRQLKEEAAIQQALGRLSPQHRSIIVLRDIEGFSYNEIAEMLGGSIGAVERRLSRARSDLKRLLIHYLRVIDY